MFTYAGIAILINCTFLLAGPRHPALAILLLVNCHWLANFFLSYCFRKENEPQFWSPERRYTNGLWGEGEWIIRT